MYYIHDWYKDGYRHFNDWWDLIEYIKNSGIEKRIAHSPKDTCSNWSCRYKSDYGFVDYEADLIDRAKLLLMGGDDRVYGFDNDRKLYVREYIVYDQWDRVVNLACIKQGLKEYKEPEEKKQRGFYWARSYYAKHPFEYRREPVPGIGKCNGRGHHGKSNKNYYSAVMETIDLFPCDGKTRQRYKSIWDWDYYTTWKSPKTWKNKKIKKQWMKHL